MPRPSPWLWPFALALAGCPEPEADDELSCDDHPVVTWQSFGQQFLSDNCQGCHASSSPDRQGAPESVTFDTESQVQEHAARMLFAATGEGPYMPPDGGPTPQERLQLQVWLTCHLD